MDVVKAPTPVTLVTQASGQPPLQPGTVINALVVQLLDQGQVRLALANTLIDVLSQVPLTPGTTVRLAVEGTPSDLRLVIVDQGGNAAVRPEAAARPPAVAGGETQVRELRAPAPVAEGGQAPPVAKALVPAATALAQAVQSAAARQNGLSPAAGRCCGGRRPGRASRAGAAGCERVAGAANAASSRSDWLATSSRRSRVRVC